MKIDWTELHHADVEFARKVLLGQGAVIPMFIVHAGTKTLAVVSQWRDDDEKRQAFLLVALLAAREGAEAIGFISEAWIRQVDHAPRETEAEFAARVKAVPPSEAEDRQEVVMCAMQYRDPVAGKRSLMTSLDIVRDATGKPVAAPKRTDDGYDRLGGAALALLSERLPDAHARARAGQIYAKALEILGLVESQHAIVLH